jgi:hypothetical protein
VPAPARPDPPTRPIGTPPDTHPHPIAANQPPRCRLSIRLAQPSASDRAVERSLKPPFSCWGLLGCLHYPSLVPALPKPGPCTTRAWSLHYPSLVPALPKPGPCTTQAWSLHYPSQLPAPIPHISPPAPTPFPSTLYNNLSDSVSKSLDFPSHIADTSRIGNRQRPESEIELSDK